jgi:transposase
MSKKQTFTLPTELRRRRHFSEEFKIQKVQEIQANLTTLSQVAQVYDVRVNNVSKWIDKYGIVNPMKGVRLIVEKDSDTYRIAQLEAKIAELERLVGQKEVLINFQVKVIDTAEKMYGVDIKKKLGAKPYNDAIWNQIPVEPEV